jgi:monofunctional biosynthetic peptidoglycan transglycosylase
LKKLLAVCLLGGIGYAVYVLAGIPSRARVRALVKGNPGETSVMAQREAEARAAKRKPRHSQSWVPLSRVSRHLIHAVLAAEDPSFFGHEGIDWDAVKESLETNWRKKSFARGGSTITQQLAKNLFFETRKSVTRKLREFVVARWLEEDLTKKRILELYLNVIEWGDGVYGCEAAAQRYYGRSAADLRETEAAGLTAMIPSPRRINPQVDPATHAKAQKRVLWLMGHLGYVPRSLAGFGATPPPEVIVPEEESEPTEQEGLLEPGVVPEPGVSPEPYPTDWPEGVSTPSPELPEGSSPELLPTPLPEPMPTEPPEAEPLPSASPTPPQAEKRTVAVV